MLVKKIIERAEKYKSLGRFDKRSAVAFLNDALYEITKRQSITISEIFYGYFGQRFKTNGLLIKFVSAGSESDTNSKLKIMNDGSMNFFFKNEHGDLIEHNTDNYPEIDEIKIEYIGYKKVSDDFKETDKIDFPSEYETALVYFIRAKMLEESAQFEEGNYFLQQFSREIQMKASPRRDIVTQPSEYSLL